MSQNFQDKFSTILRPPLLQQQQQPQMNVPFISPSVSNTSIPWNIENMPWAQPVGNLGVMHFEASNTKLDDKRRALIHAKRKSNPPVIAPPSKQFITEEKITAHFNGLHISNNFSQNVNTQSVTLMEDDAAMGSSTERSTIFASYQDYRITAKELEERLRNANRITLCEDLKKMQEENKKVALSTLVPEVLMSRIEKPCTALVLWQPPPILELLHRKNDADIRKATQQNKNVRTSSISHVNNIQDDLIEDVEFSGTDDIDDFIDNNNTSSVDYNKSMNGDMDEDL